MLPRNWRGPAAATGRHRGAMSKAASHIAFVSSDTADAKTALE
ncbi:NAD kinase, partial [Mesorhizobium sp. M7A.F.Ca.CA.002.10.1.1]